MLPNDGALPLADFLGRLDWSPERLAREINRVAGKGIISPKAPYGWLKGAYPRGQVPHIVARILSERLGEKVSVEAIWPARRSTGRHGLERKVNSGLFQSGENIELVLPDSAPVSDAMLISAAVDWL